MFIDFVQGTLIDMAKRFEASNTLQVGRTYQGKVEGQPGKLVLNASGMHVALPADSDLQPGTAVTVQLREQNQKLQLQITPQAQTGNDAPSPSASPSPTASLTHLAASILETLSGLQSNDTTLLNAARQLSPGLLPATNTEGVNAALRAVLGLFANRQAAGEELRQIAALLAKAAEAGVNLRNPQSAALLQQFTASSPEDFAQLLQRLADVLAKPAEAHLGQAVQSAVADAGSAAASSTKLPENLQQLLQTDLRSQVAQLREDPGLTRFLNNSGQLQAFQDMVSRVVDRLSGAQVQNLRGLEQPYLFMELPMTSDSPIQHGQIHVFADGGGTGRGAIDPQQASVVLDLSTTGLGDLWIHLQTNQGVCRCYFRATEPNAVSAIQGAASELVDNLQSAGYGRIQVQASLWDGNRLREAADLMRRFSGFEATA